jgi:excisionase family DNA binding protein
MGIPVFLESADIARELGVVTMTVRAAVAAGRLRVAARTVRGTRLFTREDFDAYRQYRAEHRRARRDG